MASTKIKAREKKGIVTVKSLMNHPMETGLRKDKKTGEKIPAHFINEVTCTSNGKTVFSCNWSGGISKNPYLAFKFAGSKGDELTLSWKDNKGGSDTVTETVG